MLGLYFLSAVTLLAVAALFSVTRDILRKVRCLVTSVDDVKKIISDMDAETNTLSDKIDAQTAKIAELQAKVDAGGSVESADLQSLADALSPISDRLKAIGADPANPIPAPSGGSPA